MAQHGDPGTGEVAVGPASRAKDDLAVTGLGAVGVATIVLPFTHGFSPLRVILDSLAPGDWPTAWGWIVGLTVPSFLTILIPVALLRGLVPGRFSRAEASFAWLAAAGSASGLLAFVGWALRQAEPFTTWSDILIASVAPATICVGIAALARVRRRRITPAPPLAVMAMQWAYIADALFCLFLVPLEAWQVGAYVTLAAAFVHMTHVAAVVWHVPSGRAKIAEASFPSTTGGTT
jgi:hypothetical protein